MERVKQCGCPSFMITWVLKQVLGNVMDSSGIKLWLPHKLTNGRHGWNVTKNNVFKTLWHALLINNLRRYREEASPKSKSALISYLGSNFDLTVQPNGRKPADCNSIVSSKNGSKFVVDCFSTHVLNPKSYMRQLREAINNFTSSAIWKRL